VSPLAVAIAVLLAAIALVLVIPRVLLRRAQDRLAESMLTARDARFKLLTRAELVCGKYRRAPGVLGLTENEIRFAGLFGETEALSTSRIQKIATGKRLASGRRLLRLEVLRMTRSSGEDLELVLTPASAGAWRSHLGLWAVAERKASMDRVTPGR
jgi:hypothetical protein